MPATLNLHYVDELIDVRVDQHGGGRGAPPIIDGHRVGESLNRSCLVMLSALLQGFVEDVFIECSIHVIPRLNDPNRLESYRKTFRRWGNPNPQNITLLFNRIGIENVLDDLSWRNCPNQNVKNKLNEINQIRNRIAHGEAHITLNNQTYNLTLPRVRSYRDFVCNFSYRFEGHALNFL